MIGARTAIAAGVCAVLFGLFCMACWIGGWWLFAQNVNRTAKINSQSYSAQTSDLTQISSDWTAITGDQHDLLSAPSGDQQAIKTEILGDANDLCFAYSKVTHTVQVSPDVVAFAQKNCDGDAVSATSTLRNGS